MSDTKILNMPRWGRPHKVSRTEANHAWLEEWTYFAPDGEKQLQFANGKLTGMRTPVAAVATSAPPILPSLPIEMPARATTPAPAETRIAAAVERAGPTSDAAHAVSDRQSDARDIDGASGSGQEDESR